MKGAKRDTRCIGGVSQRASQQERVSRALRQSIIISYRRNDFDTDEMLVLVRCCRLKRRRHALNVACCGRSFFFIANVLRYVVRFIHDDRERVSCVEA